MEKGHNNKIYISVIILTYNHADKIMQTLKSVISQDYSNYEIILRDDKSTEFSGQELKNLVEPVLKEWGGSYRIDFNEENYGTVKNFNLAIKSSCGKYIVSIDGGDVFYGTDVLEKIYDFFESTNCNIFTTGRYIGDNKETVPSPERLKTLSDINKTLAFMYLVSNFISGSNTYYSRKLFERYGYFNEDYRLMEDYPMYIKCLMAGERIYYAPFMSIVYEGTGVSAKGYINPMFEQDMERFKKYLYEKPLVEFKGFNKTLFDYRHDSLSGQQNKAKYVFVRLYLKMVKRL